MKKNKRKIDRYIPDIPEVYAMNVENNGYNYDSRWVRKSVITYVIPHFAPEPIDGYMEDTPPSTIKVEDEEDPAHTKWREAGNTSPVKE